MDKPNVEKGKITGMVNAQSKPESSIQNLVSEKGKDAQKPAEPKPLATVLEIISRNAKLAHERTLMQNALDELNALTFSGNKKITLTIDVANDKNYDEEAFKTSNVNAIKLSVESLIIAFKNKKEEIENSIALN
jgi:hypothetical protein